MIYTIEELLKNSNVTSWYQQAKTIWDKALANINTKDSSQIARTASSNQFEFENNCGGRFIGQEIMVITGIFRYYDEGNGFQKTLDEVQAMYQGLQKSSCSLEVKSHADDVAKLYPEITGK